MAPHSVPNGKSVPYWDEDSGEQDRGDEMRMNVDCDSQNVISSTSMLSRNESPLTSLVVPLKSTCDQPQRTRLGVERNEPVIVKITLRQR